jgi:RND family efflux transporter MFP subunit
VQPAGKGDRVKRFKPLIWVAIAAVAAVGGWWWLQRGPKVGVVATSRGTAVEIVYATGAVEPIHWAKVATLLRGRIVDFCDCEGKPVSKGDVLVHLDEREARAQLRELVAREEFLKQEMTRVSALIGRGAATEQAYQRASMDLQQIQGQISVQMERIDQYTIVAPMDGIVLRRDGEIGEIADVGQILFRVGVPKPLQVVAEVNEEDIPRVAVGQTVLLRTDAFPDQRLAGTVQDITPMGDPASKTYRIRVALPDDTPLKPGMSVEANIVTREHAGALLIPADAVQSTTVAVADGDRIRRRQIKVGIRGTRAVEVLGGLSDGDRVASPFGTNLVDGAPVRIVETPPATP